MSEVTQITQLLEEGAKILPKACKLEVAAVVDDLTGLEEAERALIQDWAPHRKNEFAAGRRCARRALERLGFKGRASLEANADGVPVWPEGFLGSITHSRGMVAVIAAKSSDMTLIGLDLEKTNRLTKAAIKRVVHPEEKDFAQDDQVKATVLFSLKEAFYKAQFPRNRTAANFQDLVLSVNSETGRAEVIAMDARFADQLNRAQFAYCLVEDFVLSLCWL